MARGDARPLFLPRRGDCVRQPARLGVSRHYVSDVMRRFEESGSVATHQGVATLPLSPPPTASASPRRRTASLVVELIGRRRRCAPPPPPPPPPPLSSLLPPPSPPPRAHRLATTTRTLSLASVGLASVGRAGVMRAYARQAAKGTTVSRTAAPRPPHRERHPARLRCHSSGDACARSPSGCSGHWSLAESQTTSGCSPGWRRL